MMNDMELDKGLRTMTVIWAAMLVSLALYLFIAMQIGETIKVAMAPDLLDILRTVFYVLSFVILLVIRIVRRLVLSGKGVGASRQLSALSDPLLQKYLAATMIALALAESIGIFGFVLFLVGKSAIDLYVLIGLAAVTMLVYRPRKDDLLALAQEEQMQAAMGGRAG